MLFTVLFALVKIPTHTRALSLLVFADAAISVGFFLSLSVLMVKITAKYNRERKYYTAHGTVSYRLVLLTTTGINAMFTQKRTRHTVNKTTANTIS